MPDDVQDLHGAPPPNGQHGGASTEVRIYEACYPPRGATVRGAKGAPRSHSIRARGTSQKPTFTARLPAGV
jgi:hypothetical protein